MQRAMLAAVTVFSLMACTESSVAPLSNDATYAELVAEYPDKTQRFDDAVSDLVHQAPTYLPDLSTAPAADDVLASAHALLRVLPSEPTDDFLARYAAHVQRVADLLERDGRGDFSGGLDPLTSDPLP